MKNRITIIFLVSLFTFQVNAQRHSQISYEVGLPTSSLKEFTGTTSFRGVSAASKWFLSDKTSIGFRFGVQVFRDKVEGIFTTEDGADVQGIQVRYVNAIPLFFTAQQYLADSQSFFRPYVGAGFGITQSFQRTDVGIFVINNNNRHFGFAPEAGIIMPVFMNFGVDLSFRYNHHLKASDSVDYTYFSISLGIFQIAGRGE